MEFRCQRTVSCQTLEKIDESLTIFDENQTKYQIFAWHCCSIESNSYRQLTILVKETNWLGTLTTKLTDENTKLIWKNNLNHRQHEFYLTEQTDSLITHFEIDEVKSIDQSNRYLIFYTSTSSVLLESKLSLSNLSYQLSSINTHFITLKEINGMIYYLADMLYSFLSNEFILFFLDKSSQYQLHHIIINENNIFDNNQQIEVEHCCCYSNEDHQRLKSQFVSCSHFLSFVNMSCEIDDDIHDDQSQLQFINLDTHFN